MGVRKLRCKDARETSRLARVPNLVRIPLSQWIRLMAWLAFQNKQLLKGIMHGLVGPIATASAKHSFVWSKWMFRTIHKRTHKYYWFARCLDRRSFHKSSQLTFYSLFCQICKTRPCTSVFVSGLVVMYTSKDWYRQCAFKAQCSWLRKYFFFPPASRLSKGP